jgi:Mg-chelatase subunit ChlI-like protein
VTATVATVAYLGLEARSVEVQVQLSAGLPRFTIVGLPDKAVAESRERVHAALASIGLALPPKRITVDLSPADLPKEVSLLPYAPGRNSITTSNITNFLSLFRSYVRIPYRALRGVAKRHCTLQLL